jgi:acyl-coenzyme A synthetase/AMP-(fatty) acid ligase/thioesterase domain-containing protein/acyl carrier protein
MPNQSTIPFSFSELLLDYWKIEQKIIRDFASKKFIITKNGSVTFQEADSFSNQICHQLRQSLTDKNSGIGIFIRDPREVIPCLMGVLKSNLYFVVLDVMFPAATLLSMIQDAAIKLILTTTPHFQQIRSLVGDSVTVLNIDEIDKTVEVDTSPLSNSADDIVQIMYTSGSTDKPKGVIEDFRYLIRGVYIKLETYRYTADDCIIRLSSFSFAGPHVDVFAALVTGLSLCYLDVKLEGFRAFPELMRRENVTFCTSTATTFRSLASVLKPDEIFPSMRTFVLAGEKRLRSDFLSIRDHFPNVKEVRLGFGSTETGFVTSSMLSLDTVLQYDSLPSGLPHSDTEVLIWDPERNSLPQGEEGEIIVHSGFLGRGYLNQPELTKTRFLPDPEKPGWQFYRTGDLGRILSDGQLMHLGRLDNMIKIRGIRIELESIENLISSYPGVVHVASKVISDYKGMKKLACYFTTEEGVKVPVSDLRKQLSQHLPIQQLPSYLIWLEKMPLTNTGKVSFEKLPLPNLTRPALSTPYAPASSDTEKKLAAIWEEHIGVSGIGVEDDFFDLGGDSLLAVIVFSAVEELLGIDLPVSTLIKAPTIRNLARIIESGLVEDSTAVVIQINESGSKSPLFFIPGKGGYPTRIRHLAKKMDADIPMYAFQNVPVLKNELLENQVELVATRFLKEINKRVAGEVIILVCESLGGKIGYEICQQLRKQKEIRPVLIMLDTYYDESIIAESSKGRRILPYFRMLTKKHTSIWFKSDWEGKKDYLQFYRETFFEKAGNFFKHKVMRRTKNSSGTEMFNKYSQIEMRNIQASQAYEVKPYPGQVILVKALRGIGSKVRANGWDKVGIQELIVEDLDCYHGSMLFEPAVSQLAIIIQSHIDASTKGSPL